MLGILKLTNPPKSPRERIPQRRERYPCQIHHRGSRFPHPAPGPVRPFSPTSGPVWCACPLILRRLIGPFVSDVTVSANPLKINDHQPAAARDTGTVFPRNQILNKSSSKDLSVIGLSINKPSIDTVFHFMIQRTVVFMYPFHHLVPASQWGWKGAPEWGWRWSLSDYKNGACFSHTITRSNEKTGASVMDDDSLRRNSVSTMHSCVFLFHP